MTPGLVSAIRLTRRDAVDAGQPHVHDHDLGLQPLDGLDHLLAALDVADQLEVGGVPEHQPEALSHGRMVVYRKALRGRVRHSAVSLLRMMRAMFDSMVVGTDGSETAREAVRQAADLAKRLDAKVHLVSAYEPVPEGRLREERQRCPTTCSGWSTRART